MKCLKIRDYMWPKHVTSSFLTNSLFLYWVSSERLVLRCHYQPLCASLVCLRWHLNQNNYRLPQQFVTMATTSPSSHQHCLRWQREKKHILWRNTLLFVSACGYDFTPVFSSWQWRRWSQCKSSQSAFRQPDMVQRSYFQTSRASSSRGHPQLMVLLSQWDVLFVINKEWKLDHVITGGCLV